MPRIRTIKPEFWGDEKLGPLCVLDRLVFLGLIGMADDAGRLLDAVKVVDAFIFPYTADTSAESLTRLAGLGRITRGLTASGQAVIQIVHWEHQKIDKPNTKGALPPIAEPSPMPRRTVGDVSPTPLRHVGASISTGTVIPVPVPSSPSSAERDVREGLQAHPVSLVIAERWAGSDGMAFGRWASLRRFAPGGTQESADVTWEDIASGLIASTTLLKPNETLSENLIAGCVRKASQKRREGPPSPRGRPNGGRVGSGGLTALDAAVRASPGFPADLDDVSDR